MQNKQTDSSLLWSLGDGSFGSGGRGGLLVHRNEKKKKREKKGEARTSTLDSSLGASWETGTTILARGSVSTIRTYDSGGGCLYSRGHFSGRLWLFFLSGSGNDGSLGGGHDVRTRRELERDGKG